MEVIKEGIIKCPQCGAPMEDIAGSKERSKCKCGFYYDCC